MSRIRQVTSILAAGFFGIALTAAAPLTNNVTATYTAFTNTLNVTGDSAKNILTLTMQNGMVILSGQNGTRINGALTWSFNHAGPITMTGNLGAGDDTMSIITSNVNIALLLLGPGNDTFSLSNSTVAIDTLDGGPGTDRFIMKGSNTLRIKTFKSIP